MDKIFCPITGSYQRSGWGTCTRASNGIGGGSRLLRLLLSWRLWRLPGGVLGSDGELRAWGAGVVDILRLLGMVMLDMLGHLWHPENESYRTIEVLGVLRFQHAKVSEGPCLDLLVTKLFLFPLSSIFCFQGDQTTN